MQNAGVDVLYTRTEDVYDTPYEKAVIGNNSGADFFISLHRNATASPGGASGIETLVYSKGGEAERLAENINEELAGLGFNNRGVIERPNLVVLRRTQMPAVLVEAGFIDSAADNEKFDAEFNEIAQAIADGLLKTIGNNTSSQEKEDEMQALYQVQVGAYKMQQFADQMLMQLQSEGFPAYIESGEDQYYRVKVGTFENLDNAAQMEQRLRRMGYNTFITRA